MTFVGFLPLLWWCVTLVLGALGVAWDSIGDLVVTWNQVGAVGLILVIPATMFVIARGRGYTTAGLGLGALFCALVLVDTVWGFVDPPDFRDPNSWSPALTTSEQWVFAVPYFAMLIPLLWALAALWRPRTAQ